MLFLQGTPLVRAQTHKKGSGKSSPAKVQRAETRADCGDGISLILPAAASQGNLLLVHLRGTDAVGEVKGLWDGREIPFWSDARHGKAAGFSLTALLGVDLERAAGVYDFSVSVEPGSGGNGSPITCKAAITVKEGRFATENLHVDKQFVEPDPEQLARAKNEQQRLRDLFDIVTPERLWRGAFRVPLDGVKTGGNFGRRRILNGQPGSPHTGVDFPAPSGTPVHATQRGRAVLAEALYFSGNTVVVDHGLGVYTLYGHLQSMEVKAGDTVEAGQVIGRVGATGRVTGPHLHWGLTVRRSRVNALQIVGLPGIG